MTKNDQITTIKTALVAIMKREGKTSLTLTAAEFLNAGEALTIDADSHSVTLTLGPARVPEALPKLLAEWEQEYNELLANQAQRQRKTGGAG